MPKEKNSHTWHCSSILPWKSHKCERWVYSSKLWALLQEVLEQTWQESWECRNLCQKNEKVQGQLPHQMYAPTLVDSSKSQWTPACCKFCWSSANDIQRNRQVFSDPWVKTHLDRIPQCGSRRMEPRSHLPWWYPSTSRPWNSFTYQCVLHVLQCWMRWGCLGVPQIRQ